MPHTPLCGTFCGNSNALKHAAWRLHGSKTCAYRPPLAPESINVSSGICIYWFSGFARPHSVFGSVVGGVLLTQVVPGRSLLARFCFCAFCDFLRCAPRVCTAATRWGGGVGWGAPLVPQTPCLSVTCLAMHKSRCVARAGERGPCGAVSGTRPYVVQRAGGVQYSLGGCLA